MKLKRIFFIGILSCIISFIIPITIGLINKDTENENIKIKGVEIGNAEIYEDDNINLDYNDQRNIDYNTNIMEEYIVGVVAAEMPVSFELEALKAQAVASRTYTICQIGYDYTKINPNEIGQAYISVENMKKNWGSNFENNYKKIKEAVYSTKGIIMKYNDEPIDAVFHSTSAGITESAENVWGKELPYIKSVQSPLDENAPNFLTEVSFEKNDFENKIKNGIVKAKNVQNIYEKFQITKRSNADYVLQVSIGDITLTGREIRTCLGLRSTDFQIKKENNKIYFITKGYGHGVGMSQYGAEFMAKEGKSFTDILNHYYFDVKICKENMN